jgi:hypothetical protein
MAFRFEPTTRARKLSHPVMEATVPGDRFLTWSSAPIVPRTPTLTVFRLWRGASAAINQAVTMMVAVMPSVSCGMQKYL